jgi:hypothetical protein
MEKYQGGDAGGSPMKRSRLALAMVILPLIAGCGGSFSLFLSVGGGTTPGSVVVASDPRADGDIRQDGLVTTGAVIFSGFDPTAPSPRPEYRGFLSFPIDGIPVGALVESAAVTFFVDRIDPLPGSGDLLLDLDHVHYGSVLAFSAFGSPGVAVGSVFAGIRLLPSASPQPVTFGVIPELQADVDDPSVRFFQLRIFGTGGLAQIVDGAGDRAGGLPPDPGLAPVLSVQFRF